jgi:hypothetical protein
MENKKTFKATKILTVVLLLTSLGRLDAQIANSYPFDSLIQNDPDVIFAEMFEGSMNNLTSSGNYWNTVSPNPSNILSDPSVPNGSHGTQSLRLITIQDGTNPNQNTLVYKTISDVTDSIFVRYYIKYDTNTRYHHSGLWVGGKNPPSSTPGNIGGTLPSGNQEFHVGTEVTGITPSNNTLFGLYTYWMGMHQSSLPPPNNYFGNEFYNSTTNDNIDLDSWNCIEIMVKLNNPVSATNGEIKLWVNGNLISNLGYQFPAGTWSFNHFTEGSGIPFEGFQFRNDNALNLNYIWLRNFNDMNSAGHQGNIYFDHLVVAKKYIGPMSTTLTTSLNDIYKPKDITLYPNPANTIVIFSTIIENLSLTNIFGQVVLQAKNISNISTESLKDGLYIIQADNKIYKLIIKH